MSGTSPDQKRKRKRKTRAERNKMLRHHTMEQDKQKKLTCTSSKDTEPAQNISYTLRSGKGAGLSSFVTKDFKKSTTGNITQDRLTRMPPMSMFSNVKSSGWIKRGPIPETDSVKKKVENDLKRILNLPDRSTGESGGGQNMAGDADKIPTGKSSSGATDNEPDVMEVDPPLMPSSPGVPKDSKQQQIQRKQTAVDKLVPKLAAVPTPAVITSCRSGHSISSNSASSVNLDETLDPTPPVQEIADTILKELKTKFNKMFPNRDIEREICSDLQKLLKQSTLQTEAPVFDSVSTSTFQVQGDPLQLSTPLIGISTPSMPTLSAFRPPKSVETRTLSPQLNHLQGIPTFFQWGVPCSEETNAGIEVKTSFTNTFLVSDHSLNSEPVFSLGLNDDDDEDDSEDDDRDILSRACCNAFMASARELEAEKQRVEELARYSSFNVTSSSCSNPYSHQKDCSHLWQHSYGSKDVSCGNFLPLHCSGMHSARILDFSDPQILTSSSCPPRCLAENLFKDHSHYQRHIHNGLNHHHSTSSCCWSGSPPPFNHGLSTDKGTFNNGRDPWRYSRSNQSFVLGTTRSSQELNGRSRVGAGDSQGSLALSRHNFQAALNSACQISERTHAKIDKPNKAESVPFESMDWAGCHDIIHGSQTSGVSDHHNLNSLSSRLAMSQPLSELQTHQADLQRQARIFLNDLDPSCIQSKPDVGCHHILTQPKHLFRVSSPDSNGSPVYMASPLLKGMGLRPGSFV